MAKDSKIVTLDDGENSETQASAPAVPAIESDVTEVVGTIFDDQLCGDKAKIEINPILLAEK